MARKPDVAPERAGFGPAVEAAAPLAWSLVTVAAALYAFTTAVPFGPLTLASRAASLAPLGPHFGAFWLGHLWRASAAFAFFAGARALGDRLLPSVDERVRGPMALGLGLGLAAAAAFALFSAGLGKPAVFRLLFWALSALGAWSLQRVRPSAGALSSVEKGLALFILAAAGLAFLGTTVPEISYDALAYHLALPQEWLRAGKMLDLPWNHFSYVPLLASLLYAYALAAGGMALAKLFCFGFAAASAWTLKRCGEALAGRTAGLAAAAAFFGTPLILYLCWAANSDLPAAFFVLLGAAAAWTGAPALAGLFCGLGLSCKYTALFAAAPILLKARLRALPLFLLVLLPWWGRNLALTGNPVYPFLVERLGPKTADLELLKDWRSETRDASPGARPGKHLRKLWDDATRGFDSVAYDFVGPIGLALLPLALWRFKLPAAALLAALFAGLCFTYITRLLLSAWIPLLLLGACAAAADRRVLWLLLFAGSFETLHFAYFTLLSGTRGLAVASGSASVDEYLSQPHNLYPNPSYPAYRFIAGLGLSPADKILSVGESRSFYCPQPVIAGVQHDVPPLYFWASRSKTPEELLAKLDALDVKIVLSNRWESERIDPPKYKTEAAVGLANAMLMKHYEIVFSDSWSIVLRRKS